MIDLYLWKVAFNFQNSQQNKLFPSGVNEYFQKIIIIICTVRFYLKRLIHKLFLGHLLINLIFKKLDFFFQKQVSFFSVSLRSFTLYFNFLLAMFVICMTSIFQQTKSLELKDNHFLYRVNLVICYWTLTGFLQSVGCNLTTLGGGGGRKKSRKFL